jgi:cell division protein FtsQ
MRAKRENNKINKTSKIRVIWSITTFVVLLSVLAIAIYISLNKIKSFFPIKDVVFYGNKHLTDDELRALAGIHKNESIITVSRKRVIRMLLKSPWIKSVSVRKELPDTLSVLIEEVTPFALLDMKGRLFIINDKGNLLEELKGDSIPFLPVITANPYSRDEGFSEALNLARSMNDLGFSSERNQIEIIVSKKPQELTAVIDGAVVKVGSGDYRKKLERLLELEEEIRKRSIPVDFIDLRFENRVIVKPVKEVIR